MKRKLAAAALVITSALAPFGMTLASAEESDALITKVGWWTRNPAANAPEEGFNVSNAADGPLAVAAIEITSTAALESAVIVLTEEGGIQQDSAKLQVCVTPNEWAAGPKQAWATAPKAECESNSVEMSRNAPSSSWGADVTSLLGDIEDKGRVSLMIVPAGAATVPVAFEVRVQEPQLNARAKPEPTTSFSGSTFSTSSSSGGDLESSSAGAPASPEFTAAPASDSFGTSTFDTPTAAVVPTVPATTSEPVAADTAPVAQTGELAALPSAASAGIVDDAAGNHTLQALFFVAIATIAGTGAGFGRWFVRRRSDEAAFV